MAEREKRQATMERSPYQIITLLTPRGERLPMLVHRCSGIPCRMALRYAVLVRRGRVAASTMVSDLRAIQLLYEWADATLRTPIDAILAREPILTGEGILTQKRIGSLAQYVKTARNTTIAGSIGDGAGLVPAVFNARWGKIKNFLFWAVRMYAPNSTDWEKDEWTFKSARERIDILFGQHGVGEEVVQPVRVLSGDEWDRVQKAITFENESIWPDPHVRWRNHTMVYLAINSGLRAGEMLTLTLDQLPKGREEHIVVERCPDNARDPRRDAPQVKTNGRAIVIPAFVRTMLATYSDEYRPPCTHNFVFCAQGGQPLSGRRMRQVAEEISATAQVHLTWHRFRHSFLDSLYETLADKPDGIDQLMEIAGWSSPLSARPYVLKARQRRGNTTLRTYQGGLYPPPAA